MSIDEVIGMAWADRISFEEIKKKDGFKRERSYKNYENKP